MPLTDEMARHAAAYKVMFERADPDACTDQTSYDRTAAVLSDIMEWARSQTPDVLAAYTTAREEITKRATNVLENNIRAKQMYAAYDMIPKPPEPIVERPFWRCVDSSCVNGQSWRISPFVTNSLRPRCPQCGSSVEVGNPLSIAPAA